MAATLLGNVVYPVYTQRSYIKHNTPGKWWDSLYTWDSGFIGLGLADLDTQRALECLNAYLTGPGAQSAFIHHGSMVPVQFYLFLDLWNRTQSREMLEYTYPRLTKMWGHLERIASGSGGSIGARGPGEMQLEIDRRLVRTRVADLKREIVKIGRAHV